MTYKTIEGLKNVEVEQFESVDELVASLEPERILTLVNSSLRSQARSKANSAKYQDRAKARRLADQIKLKIIDQLVADGKLDSSYELLVWNKDGSGVASS